MTGHNHPSGASKPAPSSSHPPSNNSTTIPVFIAVTRAVGLSRQHALDLGMLQELISSPPCHQIHACQNELCNHSRVTILSIETDQGYFWRESKVREARW
jgi:hypothetical protein